MSSLRPSGPSRRELLASAATFAIGVRGSASAQGATLLGRGQRPGEERVIVGIHFCWCPPGRFLMGSPPTEVGRGADEAQVAVTLTRGFWMSKFEATQGQWRRLVGPFPDQSPSEPFGMGDDLPVYWVNYDDAIRFGRAVAQAARASGDLGSTWDVQLPTEAQWEYACRAGTSTPTAFGGLLSAGQANFQPDAPATGPNRRPTRKAEPVGSYAPNAWGLADMHGNVFEWCRDWYHARLPGGVDPDLSDTPGERNGDGTYSRVRRGGAWNDSAIWCRSAARLRYEPHRNSDHIGFRVGIFER